jgi:hypothetical protein
MLVAECYSSCKVTEKSKKSAWKIRNKKKQIARKVETKEAGHTS